jgi:ketosteroid isomerase-like protein
MPLPGEDRSRRSHMRRDRPVVPTGRVPALEDADSAVTVRYPVATRFASLSDSLEAAESFDGRVIVNKLDDFLGPVLARHAEARKALNDGDPGPWLAMTARQDPVTLFGAKVPVRQGRDEVDETLRWLAARWSHSTVSRFDLVTAEVSGDLAYVTGLEHIANSVLGAPVEPYTLRVTHIFRREDGEWKMAHRHADRMPDDQSKAPVTSPAS